MLYEPVRVGTEAQYYCRSEIGFAEGTILNPSIDSSASTKLAPDEGDSAIHLN